MKEEITCLATVLNITTIFLLHEKCRMLFFCHIKDCPLIYQERGQKEKKREKVIMVVPTGV